jgi:hypothetical protein
MCVPHRKPVLAPFWCGLADGKVRQCFTKLYGFAGRRDKRGGEAAARVVVLADPRKIDADMQVLVS